MKYKKKIFLYFVVVFAVFTVIITFVQEQRERSYKFESLSEQMESYSDIIFRFVQGNGIDSNSVVISILPEYIRFTVIEESGKVWFDNTLNTDQEARLESHMSRPEVKEAAVNGTGTSIRYSKTKDRDYFFFAKRYASLFVRVAYPYDVELEALLRPDTYFLYFMILLFCTALVMILYLSDKLSQSIFSLKHFVDNVSEDRNKVEEFQNYKFPSTEIGEVCSKFGEAYEELDRKNHELAIERDKLIQHMNIEDKGVAIFSSSREMIYYNPHFIQLLNLILDRSAADFQEMLSHEEFSQVRDFLQNKSGGAVFDTKIYKGGNYFSVIVNVFQDESFEICLDNISEAEKNRLLKEEMTNNIAHELKTPVSAIGGYVETLLTQQDLDKEKVDYFLRRTDFQVKRLADLIRDIALVTKMGEAPGEFEMEYECIRSVIDEAVEDLSVKVGEHDDRVAVEVDPSLEIRCNHILVYSIFRNLIDNALCYAGDRVYIVIDNYANDDNYAYFKFYDSGKGVPAEHLPKLFNRFYRIDKGRSRRSGGTGLGLSIVKNAVLFHKGDISVRNRSEGGLEFLFSISRK